jgi:predicted transcriptional regulator
MAAIRKGKADVKAGRVKSHARVEKMFETWISK